MFLNYQDGNFDLADRTFHSLESAWELASGRSSSDVKELIPGTSMPRLTTLLIKYVFGQCVLSLNLKAAEMIPVSLVPLYLYILVSFIPKYMPYKVKP